MKPKPDHTLWDNLAYLLRRSHRSSPLLLPLLLLCALLEALLPLLAAYLPKAALQLVTDGATAWRAAGLLALLTLALTAAHAAHGASGACYWLVNNVRIEWMQELFLSSLTCPYRSIESARGQMLYRMAFSDMDAGDWSSPTKMLKAAASLLAGLLGFALYTGVLARLSPLVIALLTATSLLTIVCPWLQARFERRNKPAWTDVDKKLDYIRVQSQEPALGKDVRLYAMEKWLIDVRDEYLRRRSAWDKRMQNHAFASALVSLLVQLARDSLAYAYLIAKALRGELPLPDVALYAGLIAGFSQWVTGIVTQLTELLQNSRRLSDSRAFEGFTPDDVTHGTLPLPEGPLSIEFDDVSFTYPGADRSTLSHLSFTVQPGEKIALVGVNGAGKTTLVKLLCGFYTPTSGAIRIGGVDTAALSPDALLNAISAVFQDVPLLPFSVAENVAMQRADQLDRARVTDCLRISGLLDRILEEPHGIDTCITRVVQPDGIQLSGGEAQKLLLARALYKDGRLLLLDEPTAALDPIAESAQYQQYFTLSRDKTSIFISHRLASTRFCDRILFLQDGRIAETGTHDQLMSLSGPYARMYELQSRYYKEENAEQ
ncbi:MAG: ABC transporter ATP-binding protein [Candidatus Spyradocola sp.]